jgi:hypothetical protein
MDVLDLLERQHQELAEMFARVVAAGTAGQRTAGVAQLVRAVEAHSRVEETVFYAAFVEQVGGAPERLYEAYEDHVLLRFAAVNLLRTRATDVRFAARFKLVSDIFARHVAVEEDWMFPRAKRALHDEALDRIGVELERAHTSRLSVGPAIFERPRPRRRMERPASVERASVY